MAKLIAALFDKGKKLFEDVGGLALLLVSFLMAITGQAPTSWPQTSAVIAITLFTLAVWASWWPRLTLKNASKLKRVDNGQILTRDPFWVRWLEPFRSDSGLYQVSLKWRRLGGGFLALL